MITPRRNWGRIALISVLVLSLIGNAVALGAALRLRGLRNELLGPAHETAFYPREIRAALRAALAAHKATLLPELHELAALRAQIVAESMQRPFDRPRLEAEMAALRDKATALLAETQTILLDTLEAQARK